jgi:hypothetical protein
MKRRMHKNSLKAYASLKLEPLEQELLEAYRDFGPMTDRYIGIYCCYGFSVQPRVTSLLSKEYIKEYKDIKCPVSGRTVRTCKITALGRKALRK